MMNFYLYQSKLFHFVLINKKVLKENKKLVINMKNKSILRLEINNFLFQSYYL